MQEQYRSERMPFALYMIGFLVFMAGVVWAAVVVGVPQLYITIGALVLIAAGAAVGFGRSRSRRLHQRER
jgi:hypothetical protein